MKLKNIFISLMVVIGLLFGSVVAAETTIPSSYDVDSDDLYIIDSSKYLPGSSISYQFKKNTRGEYIYCLEINGSATRGGIYKHTLGGELGANYAYVLANGYPMKSITGNSEKDYFITGLAIWNLVDPNDNTFRYFNLEKGTYRDKDNDVVREVAKLVNGSRNYSYVNPSIRISTSSNTLSLSSDKKYYVSSNIGVIATGNVGNYTVNLVNAPSGTIVTDRNGNVRNTFSTGEVFMVKVPVSSINSMNINFGINVSANGTIYKAYYYVPSESRFQNTASLYPVTVPVSASTNLNLRLTTRVEISKVDAATGKELPDAILTVKDSAGKVVDSWVSTNSAHVIEGLAAGKYTLTEEYAPEGFVLSKETITFEVKLDGTVVKVVMKNEKITTRVEISKVDAVTGEELPDAVLTVKDSNGKVVDSWVSDGKAHVIEGLAAGKYTLTEEYAPKGYVLSKETITFEVKLDGKVVKVVMKNTPEKPPVVISKKDATTGEELPDAHLELYNADGELVEAWVSENTAHVIKDLPAGKYYLKEILPPKGYVLSTETVEFTVLEDGTVDKEVVMYNKPETIIEVPSTSSFKTITSSLIGLIVIGLGSMMIYKNYKKNEEI